MNRINRDTIKRIIKLSITIIIITVVIGYSIFESKDFIKGPKIEIFEPINGSSISTSTVIVKGKATRIKDLYINNRPVLIDREGNFSEYLLLLPGYNASTLSAQDRFKRTTEYKLELVYLK